MNVSTSTRAVLADAAEVVAAEVDEHHVLGALLLVGQQLRGDRDVLLGVGAARARAGDRARRDAAAGDGQQRLGAGAGDLEVAEVEEVHVRRRVDGAQPAVDRERVDRRPGADQRCEGTTWKASPAWMYSTIRATIASNCLARHVRLERRHGARRVQRRRAAAPARRAARATSAIVATASRVGASTSALVLGVDVREDRDRVLEVVEDDEHVGEHQRHVGQAELVGVRLAERLDGAHEVVAEEADRAAGERRQVGQRRLALARDLGGGERVRVAARRRATSAAPSAGGRR